MTYTDRKEAILAVAEALIQMKGFNGFSYNDIAEAVGIKKASIHYHYPTKDDLGKAVIDWHLEKLQDCLAAISRQKEKPLSECLLDMLNVILSITYRDNNKMCLGGIFAADILILPDGIKQKIKKFFNSIMDWIANLLQKHSHKKREAKLKARQLTSQIEGALLLSRLYETEDFFEGVKLLIKEIAE